MSKNKNKVKQPVVKAIVPEPDHSFRNKAALGALLVLTLLLFGRSVNYEFVNWDDFDYITNNPLIRDFSFGGFKNIFSTPVLGMYNPLPFVVYSIEYKLWGLDPKFFHLFNIIFHLLATVAIYRFIFDLTKRFETAIIVAILFAIHPMHVGVVLWASQTKTSLFLIFYFIGLRKYLSYLSSGFKIKYLVYASLLFVIACLAKPSAVTFAPMLFLLDYYKSRKIDKRLFLEKIPFVLIAAAFSVLTLLTHSDEGDSIFEMSRSYSLFNNILVSNYSLAFYIEKLFLPLDLQTIYSYPDDGILPLRYYLALPIIPLILWLVYKAGSFRKEMIFGLLFFLIAISVLLRIVPSGFFGMANRYTYLSFTGPFFIIGQFYVYIKENKFSWSPKVRRYLPLGMGVLFVFFFARSNSRVPVWENSTVLFTNIIESQPRFALAYSQRSLARIEKGDYAGGMADISKVIELEPNNAEAYINRAEFKCDLKDYESALADIEHAIRIRPGFVPAYNNRGKIRLEHKKYREAYDDFSKAIALDPECTLCYFNRALVEVQMNNMPGAISDWKVAEKLGMPEATKFLRQYTASR